jgi:two-component system, NtrC family, nitrogen regulation response regulator NtrX
MRINDENMAMLPTETVSGPPAGIPIQTVRSTVSSAPDAIFGPSLAMRKVLEQVTRAAACTGNILICGEPGTGRETVAREIHRRSPRVTSRWFVKAASTSNSPEALELDLFGFHASRPGDRGDPRNLERIARAGQLHQALGGTMFFEQLPDMPSRVQARLARLFRDGEAIVIDDGELVNFDARAIVAIERAYDEALREGRVRSDLHRVISTMRIELPPLRSRRKDIPALTGFFLDGICRTLQVPPKIADDSALQLLSAMPWHGNVSELKNLLNCLARVVRGDVIGLRDVLEAVQLDGRANPFRNGGTLREVRTQFERDYIATVLEHYHGRVPDAARALGIQRTNLYRKLRRLKVPKRNGRDRTI